MRRKRDDRQIAIAIFSEDREQGTRIPAPEFTGRKPGLEMLLDFLFYGLLSQVFARIWNILLMRNLNLYFSSTSAIWLQVLVLVLFGMFYLLPWWGKLLSGVLAAGGLGLAFGAPSVFGDTFAQMMGDVSGALRDSVDWLIWSLKLTPDKPDVAPEILPYLLLLVLSIAALVTFWRYPQPLFLTFLFVLSFFFQNAEDLQSKESVILLFAGLFCLALLYGRQMNWGLKWRTFLQLPPVVPVAILLALLIFLNNILPEDFLRNQRLYDELAFLRDRFKRDEKLPDTVNYYEFSIRDLGFYPENDRLGGPTDIVAKPFMRYDGPAEAVYLRGTVFNDFRNNIWIPSAMDPNYVFNSNDPGVEQRKAFNLDEHLFAPELRDLFYTKQNAVVFPQEQPIQVIFHPGRTAQILNRDQSREIRYFFNREGQVYASEVIPDAGYATEGWYPTLRNNEAIERTLRDAYANGLIKDLDKNEPDTAYDQIFAQYAPEIFSIIEEGRWEGDLRLEGLFKVRRYFATEYTYNLQPPPTGPDENFLAHFLQVQQGYCTYFATGLTLAARALGFEARYVEGFLVPGVTDRGVGRYERQVMSTDAHAWTEVKIPNLGWIALDATPQNVLEQMSQDPERGSAPTTTPPPEQQPEETTVPPPPTEPPEPTTTPPPETPPEEPETEIELPGWLWVILAILLFCALVGIWIWRRYVNYRRRFDLEYLRDKYDDASLMDKLWQELKELYRLKTGEALSETTTILKAYEAFMRAFKGLAKDAAAQSFSGLERFYYREDPVLDETLNGLSDYYAAIEADVKANMNGVKYFFTRILFGPNA